MDHTLFEDANQRISLVINKPDEFGFKIWRKRRTTWLSSEQVAEIAEKLLSFVGPRGSAGHMSAQEPHNGT